MSQFTTKNIYFGGYFLEQVQLCKSITTVPKTKQMLLPYKTLSAVWIVFHLLVHRCLQL